MGISRNLADVLHRIVEHLPVREEQTTLDLHAAVDAEAAQPETDSPESDSAEVAHDE